MGKTKAETIAKQQRREAIRKENLIKALEDPYWNYWNDRNHVNRISVRLTDQQEYHQLQRRIKASKDYHKKKAKMSLVTSDNNDSTATTEPLNTTATCSASSTERSLETSDNNDSNFSTEPLNTNATNVATLDSQPLRYDCPKCGKNLSYKLIPHRSNVCIRYLKTYFNK